MPMKAAPDCIECMFRQALNTARKVTDDAKKQEAVLSRLRRRPGRPRLPPRLEESRKRTPGCRG